MKTVVSLQKGDREVWTQILGPVIIVLGVLATMSIVEMSNDE